MEQVHALDPHDAAGLPAGNFSLVLGGPLYQLLRRAHLCDDTLHHVRKRILVIALLAWLPLAVLAGLEGRLLPGTVNVSFLQDVEVHVRFLLALPMLVAAELLVHTRMGRIARSFLERDLIPASHSKQFLASIESAARLRNSIPAELLLVALVYGVGVLLVWRQFVALPTDSWYALVSPEGSHLTLAGTWYGYVSLPLFQFLLLRWYFRIFIWARFLWQVTRIPLAVVPTHPDRLGGLGFLSQTVYAFSLVVVAHGTVLAGQLASRILYTGAKLTDFKAELAVMAAFMALLVFGPLLAVAPQLAEARRTGLREYGSLAQRYVRAFDAKWLRGAAPADEPLVGTADIQSLADLDGSYTVVKEMRLVPITRAAVLQLAAALLVPLTPLLLTIMPLEELLKLLAGILF
ncbi:hypothetical protein LZ009_21895 [Ramlibacter sp. XY19]|uniref:hypothetical protein n=1 Tax=Ramlibacter paludis TaxID=2908000 RepID=UPI0023DB9CCD|nr:hypothetical protein [Ramlibacter paludis]MCG2595439.1 hypothetical protein [Ramlibacter paludis]